MQDLDPIRPKAQSIFDEHKLETIHGQTLPARTRHYIAIPFNGFPDEINNTMGEFGVSINHVKTILNTEHEHFLLRYYPGSDDWRLSYELMLNEPMGPAVSDCYILSEDDAVKLLIYLISYSVPLHNNFYRSLYDATQNHQHATLRPLTLTQTGL